MSDESQIIVPPSFIAPGRSKPNASRDEIAARYEFCEDLANLLVDHASTKLWELGVTRADVLERTHRGLLAGDASVTPAQAEWVIRRLAELLGWDPGSIEAAGAQFMLQRSESVTQDPPTNPLTGCERVTSARSRR